MKYLSDLIPEDNEKEKLLVVKMLQSEVLNSYK